MIIGIVGMGLMGGSFCRALKLYTTHEVLGTTKEDCTIAFAKSIGAIDGALLDLSVVDFCIVALPPEATVSYLLDHVGDFSKNTIVMDICGVKGPVIREVDELYYDHSVRFIGGHPMAGKELAGFSNSDGDLYQGSSFILTPTALTCRDALLLVTDVLHHIGFAQVIESTVQEHDRIIAYTSQLAHVVSNAYIKSPTNQKVTGFSAGSFQDMTRVAKLDPQMWASLFLANKMPLLEEIDVLIENLTHFRKELSLENRDNMVTALQKGSDLREEVILRMHNS